MESTTCEAGTASAGLGVSSDLSQHASTPGKRSLIAKALLRSANVLFSPSLACAHARDILWNHVPGASGVDLSVSARPGASEEAGRREKTKTENKRGGPGPGMKNQKNTPLGP